MQTYDFSRSYFRFRIDLAAQPMVTLSHKPPTTVNNVRINLDCRIALTDRRAGTTQVFGLGVSCKTERVGAERDLWLLPNADFKPVVGEEDFLIIKSWQKKNMGVMRHPASLGPQPERQVGLVKEAWVNASVTFREVPGRVLGDVNAIIEGIRSERPLVCRSAYSAPGGDYDVVIDHPVKTINFSEREGVYQTDTGPILLPDLSPERLGREEKLIGCLDLAYSALNASSWAEFIVNAPTQLAPDISVNHYAQPRRIEGMVNQIIEVLD